MVALLVAISAAGFNVVRSNQDQRPRAASALFKDSTTQYHYGGVSRQPNIHSCADGTNGADTQTDSSGNLGFAAIVA